LVENAEIQHIIIDPHHGLQDCINGTLKCVGTADRRFYEDALRLIRALRITNTINDKLNLKGSTHHFDIESETWRSIKKNYYMIQFIAKERIKTEIFKAFEGNNPFGLIALLDETNMLKYLFPALHQTKHIDQPVRYHPFDVYAHSMLTVWHLQQFNPNPLVKL
jgi:tRNA nucleotidyltransferase (CCA-adding enzyme)